MNNEPCNKIIGFAKVVKIANITKSKKQGINILRLFNGHKTKFIFYLPSSN